MTDEEQHSVVINIPKSKSFDEKKLHDTKTQTYEKKSSRKIKFPKNDYTLPAITVIKPLPVETFKKDVLLPYLRYSKKQEKDRFKERLGIDLRENYKIAYTDLQKRIYTEEPENECRGIADVDPMFYTCARSTFLSSYVAPYKSLRHLFNHQLRLRQEVGYRHDCMLKIDTNHKKEQEVYNASVEKYTKQVKLLDEFISDDYKKSMLCLNEWETVKLSVERKTFELQYWAAEMFTTTSKIIGLHYRYGLQQKYGRFLYYLSPPSFRTQNRNFARSVEIEAKGFDFGITSEEDTFNVIFEQLKKECDEGLVKPVLYFRRSLDLLEIFESIEQQQLHHFTHVAQITPHLTHLKKGIKLFKDIIAQDSSGVVTLIKEFENMLLFCEERSSQLETKFFKILNGLFYDSVGAPEVLKLQLHLEFCYAKVFNEKPMNLGISGTAKALEGFYMEFTKRMESITADNIKRAIKEYTESEKLKFKKAKLAARELRLFERLEQALLRAYAPLKVNQSTLVVQPKMKHTPSKKNQVKTCLQDNRKKLTESELEYLSLFTDWTEKDDPAKYLQSLSNEDDEHNKEVNET